MLVVNLLKCYLRSTRGVTRVCLLLIVLISCLNVQAQEERTLWLNYLEKVAGPVLKNLAADQLKTKMPVAVSANADRPELRRGVAYLEAFGRTLSGIAPWMQLEGGSASEIALRKQYRSWAVQALRNAVDPAAEDYMQWTGGQPLVDASFLAFGLVRCPWLWQQLDTVTKQRLILVLRGTRTTLPVYSNWILFPAMIEAFFLKYGYDYDPVRIEFAVRQFVQHWYVGDGMFSDGMQFAMDYYNSIVIHPFLAAIVAIAQTKGNTYANFAEKLLSANQRYATILERSIHVDGSFSALGRSLTYRSGVFHHLADMALRRQLPNGIKPAQVRNALTAVLSRTLSAKGTFDNQGWLNIGLAGAQPSLGEFYITTGSLYLCAEAFLPLGLPASDPFWSDPPAPWTAVKVWGGGDIPADHSIDINF